MRRTLFPHPSRFASRGRAAAVVAVTGAALLMSACSPAVSVPAPPSAADPACSAIMLSLPQEIDGQAKRVTTSQSTAAWGEPASIVLECGAAETGPSSDPCTTLDGVDWVAHENEAKDSWTLSAYGRAPHLSVTIDTSTVTSAAVATALTESAKRATVSKRCLDAP